MAAPVLSNSEQRNALSVKGKTKRKKITKTLLGLPTHLSVGVHKSELNEIQKLNKILVRLLPVAKIPFQTNVKLKKVTQKFEKIVNESEIKLAKSKRSQLSIGVNEVYKCLKKKILSAVLLADDIQPKFLVHHINLLCTHNKIPFLALPKFRDLTKTTLGFPCIILGFKRDFNGFAEIVNEIKNLYECQKAKNRNENKEIVSEAEDEKVIVEDSKEVKSNVKDEQSVTEFTYLNRSSKSQRTFIPENGTMKSNESDIRFILVPKDNDFGKDKITELKYNKRRKNKLLDLEDLHTNIEESNVPKKRIKRNQVIAERNFRYFPTNMIITQSNVGRISKRNK